MLRFRKKPRSHSLLAYGRHYWVRAITLCSLVFLYAPLLTLVAFSFNNSRRNIVWRGFTLDYYFKVFEDEALLAAFANSLTIAFLSTCLSLVLGLLAAYGLWRFRFPFKWAYEGALGVPIVIPEICLAVALMAFFHKIGWPNHWPWPLNLSAIIASHVSFSFPFAALIIRARLNNFNPELEQAASDLGANAWQVLFNIVLPFLGPALFSAALLCFTLSLDDFVITFFTSAPETITFPLKVYSMIRFSVTPAVNAASTLLIAITVFLTTLAFLVQLRLRNKTARLQSKSSYQ